MKTPEEWRALFERQRKEADIGLTREIESAEKCSHLVFGRTYLSQYKKPTSFERASSPNKQWLQ
jgi:hypothetical protein